MQESASQKFIRSAPNTSMMKIAALVLLFVAVAYAELTISKVSVAVMDGQDAIIPCKYTSDYKSEPTITWYAVTEDGPQRLFYYGDEDDMFIDGDSIRKNLTAVKEDGSLVIQKATLADNEILSTIRCSLEFGREGSGVQDMSFVVAKLQSSNPKTILNPYGEGNSGFEISEFGHKTNLGSCEGDFVYPEASITFYKNGKSMSIAGADNPLAGFTDPTTFDKGPDGITMATKKELYKVLDESDHQAEIICSVKLVYGEEQQIRNSTMPKFNVNHATTKAMFELSSEFAYLGEEITLSCKTNGFPEPTITIDGEERASFTFTVTSDMDGKTFACAASNSGDGSTPVTAEYTMDVLYIEEPDIQGEEEVALGESRTVTCTAQGTPTPSVAWYKNDAKYTEDGTLTFDTASFDMSGKYTCQASNGHEALKRISEFNLSVRGILLSGDEEEEVEGKKDETVTLTCLVKSNPEAEIVWDVPNSEGAATVQTDYTFSSTVEVGPLVPELSEKTYTCTATNGDGRQAIKSFKLPVIAEPATATAGIVISILVIILVVAIILAVLYNKGIICKKAEKGEESAEGDIAVEINNDEADVEAGNGKPADDAPANQEEEKLMNGQETNE